MATADASQPGATEVAQGQHAPCYAAIKRVGDIALALALIPLLLPLALFLALAVRRTSPGPVFHWSQRIGADGQLFAMPKFRTMKLGTPAITTHLLADPAAALTPIGGFLRRTSIDELPQLWSVLTGDMGFVGPRPALFNQHDLIEWRTAAGIDTLTPGITGWAQVNGRDDVPLHRKVDLETEYQRRRGIILDLRILARTIVCVVRREGIWH